MGWYIEHSRRFRHHLSRLEVWELERFGRSGLGISMRMKVCVLATTGRRSGVIRKTPVTYMPYEDGWLTSGGAGGQKPVPDWVFNLRATPKAQITIKRKVIDVAVEEPTGDDRERAYAAALEEWPEILKYERLGQRSIPLFVFRPTG